MEFAGLARLTRSRTTFGIETWRSERAPLMRACYVRQPLGFMWVEHDYSHVLVSDFSLEICMVCRCRFRRSMNSITEGEASSSTFTAWRQQVPLSDKSEADTAVVEAAQEYGGKTRREFDHAQVVSSCMSLCHSCLSLETWYYRHF